MDKTLTIVTPIYYVNSVPHIGTALTTIVSDVCARYGKVRGQKTWFVTGTDENGLKVHEAAVKAGRDPHEFVAEIAEEFKRIWREMDIEFDDFIRTNEPRHHKAVQAAYEKLRAAGYIYADKYEGWYDLSTETFFKETELVDGQSPDGNPVTWVSEENDFFKLSAFQDKILAHIEANPTFILPETRKNEVVAFIKQGLRDVCVTRTNPGWGIPVPGNESKVVYVWFDALLNYIAACGWPDEGWEGKWPADLQMMGKDILTRFHATLWPAMLMGLDLPLPKTLFGHGWILMGKDKISKSLGNVVAPIDLAKELAERGGCTLPVAKDAVRYYSIATLPVESDSTFSVEEFDRKYNADLANDLGNALNRSLSMAHQFLGGVIPDCDPESEVAQKITEAKQGFEKAMETWRCDEAANAAMDLIRFLNKYINDRAPWNLSKNQDPALQPVMYGMLLGIRSAVCLLSPVVPNTATEIARQLNVPVAVSWEEIGSKASLLAGTQLGSPSPIFPRLQPPKPAPKQQPAAEKQPAPKKEEKPVEPISIDDFAKVQLRVGRILEAEPLEGSDKLLKLQVVIDKEKRQIVAGIRAGYQPVDLIGRQVVVVANLKPATLRGVESQGMLLAAVDADGKAILLQPDREAPEGATVR